MKKILLVAGAIALASSTFAQSTGEALLFSRYNFGMSTARSAGMGGAFTSLGADVASMSINPAGLAMYNSNEIVFSPGIKIGNTMSDIGVDANGAKINGNRASTGGRATINNFGAVFATGEWAIGVGYNRIADFYNNNDATGLYGEPSMAYIFRDQLQGIQAGTIGTDASGFGFMHNPVNWNAIMGYQTFFVDPVTPDDPQETSYTLQGILAPGDLVGSTLSNHTEGGIDEIPLTAAWNFNNIVYIGATLGFQSIQYRQHSVYREYADLEYNLGEFDMMEIRQNTNISGFGFNVKLGITVRPVSWFRVGVAYHSPTWMSMEERSYSDMYSAFTKSGEYDTFTPDLAQDYNMRSPSRLLGGFSFTIAKRLIISADYERTWYGNMKYNTPLRVDGWRAPVGANDIDALPIFSNNTSSNGVVDINNMIRSNYRATNNYRVGVEVQPINGLFARAGFGYSESPYQKIESYLKPGTKLSDYGAWTQWSGGLGYRSQRFSVDATYVYGSTKQLPSAFFDYITSHNYENIAAGTEIISESNIYRTVENHNIILSVAWRF